VSEKHDGIIKNASLRTSTRAFTPHLSAFDPPCGRPLWTPPILMHVVVVGDVTLLSLGFGIATAGLCADSGHGNVM